MGFVDMFREKDNGYSEMDGSTRSTSKNGGRNV